MGYNKVAEALKICKERHSVGCRRCPFHAEKDCISAMTTAALSLLERLNIEHRPAKPAKFKTDYGKFSVEIFHCPSCLPHSSPSTVADTIVEKYEPVCKKCGQVLDWSDVDRNCETCTYVETTEKGLYCCYHGRAAESFCSYYKEVGNGDNS